MQTFIKHYDDKMIVRKESQIHNDKDLISNPYRMVVCSNGDICIAGQTCDWFLADEYLINVLDSDFNFRFSYDRNSPTHIFRPFSIAIYLKDNVIMVAKQRDKIKTLTILRKIISKP